MSSPSSVSNVVAESPSPSGSPSPLAESLETPKTPSDDAKQKAKPRDKKEEMEIKRRYAFDEIIQTEKIYVHGLQTLDKVPLQTPQSLWSAQLYKVSFR